MEIGRCFTGGTDSLRLGIVDTLGTRYLMRALNLFSEQYPDVEILLHETRQEELLKLLQSGVVEAVFLRVKKDEFDGLETVFSQPDYLVACYQKGTFFVGNDAEKVSISELSKFPLCVTEENVPLLRATFREAGATFMPKFVASNTNGCLLWAQAGKGVALVPRLSIAMLGFSDLPHKQIDGKLLDTASLALITQKTQFRSKIINSFLTVCAALNGDQIIQYRAEPVVEPTLPE